MTTIDQRENSHVFSIMKGLGIIFVVAGHTAYSPVHNFVYLFHLAVFYFVAGYFFKDKYIDDKLLFVWKKIKSLWFPLVGYGIVFMLLHNLFFRAHFYNPLTSHLYTRQDYFDCLKYLSRPEKGLQKRVNLMQQKTNSDLSRHYLARQLRHMVLQGYLGGGGGGGGISW